MERRMEGERRGRSIGFEGLPIESVVYVGRQSFRMEPAALEDGVVQAAPLVSTAPYGIDARDEGRIVIQLDRAVSSGSWRAPSLPSLFESAADIDLPRLAAPAGELSPSRHRVVTLSRAALAAVGALVFASGLATASLVLQARASAPSPAPVAVGAQPIAEPIAPQAVAEPAPATIQLATPVKVRAAKKPVRRAPAPAPKRATHAWIDPFAE